MQRTPDGSVADPRPHDPQKEIALRLGEVADSIPALISYVDSGLRYRYVNQTYSEWFQVDKADVVGKHLKEVLGHSAYSSILPELSRALAGETLTFEKFVPYRSGGPRNVLITYIPDRSGSTVQGFFAIVLDRLRAPLHDHAIPFGAANVVDRKAAAKSRGLFRIAVRDRRQQERGQDEHPHQEAAREDHGQQEAHRAYAHRDDVATLPS